MNESGRLSPSLQKARGARGGGNLRIAKRRKGEGGRKADEKVGNGYNGSTLIRGNVSD